MNLGRTLVGGLIGAAVAIGIYVALLLGGQTASWFPVVTGALVGFGVMQVCKTAGNPSYARGAISGLIAAAAMLGGDLIAKEVLTKKAEAISTKQGEVKKAELKDEESEEEGEESEGEEEEAEAAPDPIEVEEVDPEKGRIGAPNKLGQNDVWPFAFMAFGIFLAYEFARGTAPKTVAEESETTVAAVDEEEAEKDEV